MDSTKSLSYQQLTAFYVPTIQNIQKIQKLQRAIYIAYLIPYTCNFIFLWIIRIMG